MIPYILILHLSPIYLYLYPFPTNLIPTSSHLLRNNFRKSPRHIPLLLLRLPNRKQYLLNPQPDLVRASRLPQLIQRSHQISIVVKSVDFAEDRLEFPVVVDVGYGEFAVEDLLEVELAEDGSLGGCS